MRIRRLVVVVRRGVEMRGIIEVGLMGLSGKVDSNVRIVLEWII